MNKLQLLITDIDGTLLNTKLDNRNQEKIQKLYQ